MPESPPKPLRLVLVDDHEMVLHGLDAMLGHFPDEVAIVGRATTASAALGLVAEESPDVVLCDVRIGKESGLDLCRQITTQHPETKVVLLTVYDDEHYLYQALRVGASGYILKRIDGQELVTHLRRIREGEIVVDHALAGRVALSAARLSAGEFWSGAHLGATLRGSSIGVSLLQSSADPPLGCLVLADAVLGVDAEEEPGRRGASSAGSSTPDRGSDPRRGR